MIQDLIDSRIDHLAQLRRTTGLYKAIAKRLGEVPAPDHSADRLLKQKAAAAYAAWESAVRDCDAELIEATRQRFIEAGEAMKQAARATAVRSLVRKGADREHA